MLISNKFSFQQVLYGPSDGFDQGLSIERVKKLHTDFTDIQ